VCCYKKKYIDSSLRICNIDINRRNRFRFRSERNVTLLENSAALRYADDRVCLKVRVIIIRSRGYSDTGAIGKVRKPVWAVFVSIWEMQSKYAAVS